MRELDQRNMNGVRQELVAVVDIAHVDLSKFVGMTRAGRILGCLPAGFNSWTFPSDGKRPTGTIPLSSLSGAFHTFRRFPIVRSHAATNFQVISLVMWYVGSAGKCQACRTGCQQAKRERHQVIVAQKRHANVFTSERQGLRCCVQKAVHESHL